MLGSNPLSLYVESTLRREGIDLGPVVRHDEAEPVHSTIIVDTGQHTRSILFHVGGRTGADDFLPAADIIRASRVLFIDHYGIAGNLRAAAVARAAGIPVVADFERRNVPRFAEILPWVDHLILASGFACQLTGATDVEDAARQLRQHTNGTVIITSGAAGCFYVAPESPTLQHHPAFSVTVTDTTGCGDVFHGAYAATLAEGADLATRIRFASAAAALKATGYGAQAGSPHRAAVEQFLMHTDKKAD